MTDLFEIRAFVFGLEMESWGIQEGKVPTFDALAQVLWGNRYNDPEGNVYSVRLTLQDAMGHRTAEVNSFCSRFPDRIFPTQGKQTLATPYNFTNLQFYPGSKKSIRGGLRLYRFDSNYFKIK